MSDLVWCERCQQEQPYAKIWAFAPKSEGGLRPFRVGTWVKCSICSAIFVAILPGEEKKHANTDKGTSVLEGGRADSTSKE